VNSIVSAPVLAIDTSGSFCSVALYGGAGTTLHLESDGAGDHFERISSLVDEVLRLGDVGVSDLSHIRIGLGPGSFTGLRIGMSFAKGLSTAARVPLVGVSTFAGVAQVIVLDGSYPACERLVVIADARRDEVFVAEYVAGAQGAKEVFSPRIESVSWVSKWASQYPAGVIATPNVGFQLLHGIQPCVESSVAKGLLLLDVGTIPPFSIVQLSELEPNYLRAVAAKSIEERRAS
jgi:tRNA threonylcarbamoyladenosine biosynthesis protein TsaB